MANVAVSRKVRDIEREVKNVTKMIKNIQIRFRKRKQLQNLEFKIKYFYYLIAFFLIN